MSTSEEEKLSRLQAEGDQALAEVMTEHAPRLRRMVALRTDVRLSRRLDPADVLQEAYLEARKRLPRYLSDPETPPFVWLRGIVLNTLFDFHRRHLGARMRDAAQEVSLQRSFASQTNSAMLAACLVGNLTSPSQAAIRRERVLQIEQVLEQMDEIDREVLVLRHLEQLSNDEVAAILGVKKAAASRRYRRALDRFRAVLTDNPGFEP